MAELVAIGDSLTQGAQSFAVSHADQSYPARVAECLGLGPLEFRSPRFLGGGGLPFDLEWMARRLERLYGSDIARFEWLGAFYHVAEMLDAAEEYWERGRGARPVADGRYHNLGIWNFQVCDAYTTTARRCDERLARSRDELLEPPSYGRMRIARRVLDPADTDARRDETQLDAARAIRERDGRIEHLIVALGANNCLKSVLELDVRETGPSSPGPGSRCTLWTPDAFVEELGRLADGVERIGAERVYLATVPRVTRLPILRGVGAPRPGERADHYTSAWIADERFRPDRDPSLTGGQVARIDRYIDEYNDAIRAVAADRGWTVVDICGLVDALSGSSGEAARRAALPPEIADLSMGFLEISHAGHVQSGGLVSLDGMHPTGTGYALFARAFVEAMRPHRPSIEPVDFARARREDGLVSSPPATLDDIFGMLELLERRLHLSRWLVLTDEHGPALRSR